LLKNIESLLLILLSSLVSAPSYVFAQDEAKPVAIPAESEKALSGHVNKSESAQHIARPANNVKNQAAKNSTLVPPALRQNYDFRLPGNAQSAPRKKLFEAGVSSTAAQSREPLDSLPAIDLVMEESTDEGLIHWDAWHRQFVENLYLRFHRANNGDYPGSCRIIITVNRDGDLDFDGGDDYRAQSAQFKNTLSRSLRMIARSGFLRFPDGSQRQQVRFSMSIRASKEQGNANFGWTRGDTELVPAK
jgi:hypothetical protein